MPTATVVASTENVSPGGTAWGSATFTPVANASYLAYAISTYASDMANFAGSFSAGGTNIAFGPSLVATEYSSATAWYHGIACWKFQAGPAPSGTSTFRADHLGTSTDITKVIVVRIDDGRAWVDLVAQSASLANTAGNGYLGGTEHTYNLPIGPAAASLLLGICTWDEDVSGQGAFAPAGWIELHWADHDPEVLLYIKTGTTSPVCVQPADANSNGGFASITLELPPPIPVARTPTAALLGLRR